MSTNDQNARLCGIGTLLFAIVSAYSAISLLTLFFPSPPLFVPVGFLFPLIGVVGFILFMVGLKGLSVRYQTPAIFDNALYGLLSTIVGVVVIFVVSFIVFFISLSNIVRSLPPFTTSTDILNSMGIFGGIFIPIVIAGLIVGLITARFYYKAFNLLAEKSGVNRFRTVGLLYVVSVIFVGALMLVGAVLVATNTILFTFMFTLVTPINVITCAAFVLATLGFFSIKASAYQVTTNVPTSQYAAPQVKYCTNCEAPNRIDAIYCTKCGKPMQPTNSTP